MENLFIPYLSLAIVLLFYAKFIFRNKTKPILNLLPSPPGRRAGWPLLGETLDYLSNLKNGSLDKFVECRRKKYSSKVFLTSLIGHPMAIIGGAEGNKFLFTNEEKLVRVWIPHSVRKIFNVPVKEDLKKLRKFLLMFIRPSALQDSVCNMDMLMKQRIKGFARDGTIINVREMSGNYTIAVACHLLLGSTEPGLINRLQVLMKDIGGGLLTIPINFPGTAFSRAVKAARVICEEMEEMIQQRRIDLLKEKMLPPMHDVLSHMVLATDEDGTMFTEAQIANRIIGFLHAGFESTRAGLTFIVKYLAEFPDVYNKVQIEQREIASSKSENKLLNWADISKMKYSWNVACEVFRLMPPVAGMFREAITDFTYEGYAIAKGTKIHWLVQPTHSDSNYFSNTHEFDPSRFEKKEFPTYSYVPFGAGPRMCPARDYTKLLTLVFMHNMVTKFKWDLVIPNEKVVFDPQPRPIQGLPIRLFVYKT